MGKKKRENFLDYVPKRNKLYQWDLNQKKQVEVAVVNRGLFNRIAQLLFRKPKVSKIELDELGSFIWQEMDGAKTAGNKTQHLGELPIISRSTHPTLLCTQETDPEQINCPASSRLL